MTTGDEPRRRRSAFALVKELVSGSIGLAKLELRRGRQEIFDNLGKLRGGAVLIAVAIGLLLLFLILLPAYILSLLVMIGLWWVALLVLLGLLAVALLLGFLGYRRVRSANLKPEETIASVKEDVEWAKRLLRRE